MSSDEETYVIIVGDDDYEIPDSMKDVVENSEITNLPVFEEAELNNIEIKYEPVDEELIKEEPIDEVIINEETVFNFEGDYVVKEEENDFTQDEPFDDQDEEYIPKEEEVSSDDDYISDEDMNRSRRKKVRVISSYVQELREAYPELRNDRKMLIDILAQIMRAMKPPPLPQDYFIMNGIMLECIKCGKLSNGIPAAGRHFQEYHGERYLICFACGVDFRSPTNLYKHEKRCIAPDIGIVLKARARHIGSKGRNRPYLEPDKPKEPEFVEEVRVRRVRQAVRTELRADAARATRAPQPAAALCMPDMSEEVPANVIVETTYEEGPWHVTYD